MTDPCRATSRWLSHEWLLAGPSGSGRDTIGAQNDIVQSSSPSHTSSLFLKQEMWVQEESGLDSELLNMSNLNSNLPLSIESHCMIWAQILGSQFNVPASCAFLILYNLIVGKKSEEAVIYMLSWTPGGNVEYSTFRQSVNTCNTVILWNIYVNGLPLNSYCFSFNSSVRILMYSCLLRAHNFYGYWI